MKKSIVHVLTYSLIHPKNGYDAVTYIRHVHKIGLISTEFVTTESEVTPLTSVSSSRLELIVAILGLRLAHSSVSAHGLQADKMLFWSDSTNALW